MVRGWVAALVVISAGRASAAPRVDFNREVRPVLSDKCFACHGPDTAKVKAGLRLDSRAAAIAPAKSGRPAVVPGQPDESELIRRITTPDADDVMPPAQSHKSLTAAEKDQLRRWIAEGAEYRGHWAYQPRVKPAVSPRTNAIDYLVRTRLAAEGLRPAAPADRRTLARRLSLDLVGLPPKPEAVDAFERDPAPDAYARMVERLLASPHYGERMAIGWLDVARFADTIGYHSDNPRPIWPYRDYVIRAFNANKPFDQFTREQLAGDLLPNPTLEQKVASGFNRLLLTTEEGGAQPRDYEARYLTDRVRAVGAAWLGQTIGCAPCHDHKFDPITARDFYSLGAFFADIKEPAIGSRGEGLLVPDDAQARELERLEREVARLQKDFDGPQPALATAFGDWERSQRDAVANDGLWAPLHSARAESSGGATLNIRDDHSVLASGPTPDTDTYALRFTNPPPGAIGLRLEALPDDSLPAKGPGRAGNGNFVVTKIVARVLREGAEPRGLAFRSATATHEQTSHVEENPYKLWSAASAIDGDVKGEHAGWAILPHVGEPQSMYLAFDAPLTLAVGEALEVAIQQNHGHEHHTLGRFRIAAATDAEALHAPAVRRVSPELATILAVPVAQRDPAQAGRVFAEFKARTPALASLRQQLADARKAKSEFEARVPRSLVVERQDPPRTVRILSRGNFLLETGDIVEPALPAFLAPAPPAGRRLTRLELADWLVARDNPLTARVVMNRLWKQFFGMGLSRVLDDFGAQGEAPPHPDLLDWLASEFVDSGWDMKHMVRLIVTSETYRQASTAPREELARDPYNRSLARQGRWRLEAELVRDSALTFAGLLQPTLGGPSFKPYQPDGYWDNLNFPPRTYEADAGSAQYRRGLYVWWQRSFLHPSFAAFDAPSREECAAERNRSNIPQQALVLLNDPIYVEAARGLAVRILRECQGDEPARITWAWQQTLARAPSADELAVVIALLNRHRDDYRKAPEAAAAYLKVGASPVPADLSPAELAAWTEVARTLLNLHETITRS